MAKNYRKYKYFENRPDVVQIFEDLEKLHDFCRFELLPYNPADLYNQSSKIWQYYQSTLNPNKRHKYTNRRRQYKRG